MARTVPEVNDELLAEAAEICLRAGVRTARAGRVEKAW